MTTTQTHPNISTEHQADGDARRPNDTLGQGRTETQPNPNISTENGRDAAGEDRAGDTPGGQDQERVEDRPNVGQVKPDDYPQQQ